MDDNSKYPYPWKAVKVTGHIKGWAVFDGTGKLLADAALSELAAKAIANLARPSRADAELERAYEILAAVYQIQGLVSSKIPAVQLRHDISMVCANIIKEVTE